MYYRETVEQNMYTQEKEKDPKPWPSNAWPTALAIKAASEPSPHSRWTRFRDDLHADAENRPIPYASRTPAGAYSRRAAAPKTAARPAPAPVAAFMAPAL